MNTRVRDSKALLTLLVCGYLQAAAVAWPWPMGEWLQRGQALGLLQLAAMAVAVAIIHRSTSPFQAAIRTGVFASTWLLSSFAWLYVSMHEYGGLPSAAAAAAVWALACALAVYYATAGALYVRWRGQHPLAAAVLFAALWTLAELARGQWLTGFPWGAIGYAQVDLWGDWLPWLGVYGVGAVAAGLAAWMGVMWAHGKRTATLWAWAVVVLMATVSPPLPTTESTGQLRAWLLQGNIGQDQKFNQQTGIQAALSWYPEQWLAALDAPERPDVVVTPETAIPVLPQQIPTDWWREHLQALGNASDAGPEVHWMSGMPLGSAEDGYTNSVWGMGSRGARQRLAANGGEPVWDPSGTGAYRYDKHHLVPMGEFIPPLFRWFIDLMNIPLGDFERGALVQAPWRIQGQDVAAHICFEDVFGEELAQTVAHTPASVLVNVSNLAWFGGTIALDQHLNIARVRALELGRPIVRSTNTGATAHIDHRGRVLARLPHQTRGVLAVTVEGRSGQTPYVRWVSALGLWPLWLWALAVLGLSIWARRRNGG